MATVEVVSATSAFHAERIEEEKTTTEEAIATVEEVVVAPAPQVAKETETTITPTAVDSDESADASNGDAPTAEEVKVKAESIPEEAVASVEQEKESNEEEVEPEAEADVEEEKTSEQVEETVEAAAGEVEDETKKTEE